LGFLRDLLKTTRLPVKARHLHQGRLGPHGKDFLDAIIDSARRAQDCGVVLLSTPPPSIVAVPLLLEAATQFPDLVVARTVKWRCGPAGNR